MLCPSSRTVAGRYCNPFTHAALCPYCFISRISVGSIFEDLVPFSFIYSELKWLQTQSPKANHWMPMHTLTVPGNHSKLHAQPSAYLFAESAHSRTDGVLSHLEFIGSVVTFVSHHGGARGSSFSRIWESLDTEAAAINEWRRWSEKKSRKTRSEWL